MERTGGIAGACVFAAGAMASGSSPPSSTSPQARSAPMSASGIRLPGLRSVLSMAAASSGLLPGMPPVYVKDADENGLFQWQLAPLEEKAVQITKLVMGTMNVQFARGFA